MTESQFLLGKLQTDEVFRNKVLGAHTMAERTEVIAAKGFSCSIAQIRAVLAELLGESQAESKTMFTLWGNKITH